MEVRSKSPTVMGGLGWEPCGKTCPVGRVGVAIKAAGKETRVAGRPGVACIGMLLVLLREVDAIRRGTGLGVLLIGSVLKSVSLPGTFTGRRGMSQ